ncbi:MAG TPA: trehalose-phosphatase [Polyangiaceae bacterium]|nr:trehalose-phosphatase [Polyangiaceae bacterium]
MIEHWQSVARHTPLAILTDLDGTLIPFAPTPEDAVPDPELLELLRSLTALPGVHVIVVSGRPHEVLERYFSDPSVWLVAEHGAWYRGDGAWQPTIDLDPKPVQELADRLDAIAKPYAGARVERKTWSCAVHYRQMPHHARAAFGVEATLAIDQFLFGHASFERVDGNQVIEVRAAAARKSFAAGWAKRQLNDVRLVTIGDDLTDEHLFAALGPLDEAVLVRGGIPHRSRAQWEVAGVDGVRQFLAFLRDTRSGARPGVLPVRPLRPPIRPSLPDESLLVVSNRLPDLRWAEPVDRVQRNNVGGLVSALEPILSARHGLWLGWSGRVVPDADEPSHGVDEGSPALAWFDYRQSWLRDYYNGFCNATLWPLFHSFPNRVVIDEATWKSYVDVHEVFADAAQRHAGPNDTVWVHDYHLLLLARALRARGHRGRIGLFLHIPFPSLDILEMLPWARDVIDAMLDFDLIGFHTPSYLRNFLSCAGALSGSRSGPAVVEQRGHFTRVAALPIAIFPQSFQEAPEPALVQEIEDLARSLGTAKLVLGVDRLDYTKGIPERLLAFGRLLELFPEWRGKVSLIQISVPSRADVPEYAEQRAIVESVVGRINGQFGEAHWVPIRYLYRGYSRPHLSQLYRSARVGYVTPLRDGMNLVAKEYVAAQDPADPGVLVLSQFAGAAAEMKDAILTNPYWADGMARDLDRALRMPLQERKIRHERSLAIVERTTAQSWAASFLDALAECPSRRLGP